MLYECSKNISAYDRWKAASDVECFVWVLQHVTTPQRNRTEFSATEDILTLADEVYVALQQATSKAHIILIFAWIS